MEYVVLVDDNFHYTDETERHELGRFSDLDAAEAACKALVDQFLVTHLSLKSTARELYDYYVAFGDDPFIVSSDRSRIEFSAWTYARQRCEELLPPNLPEERTSDPRRSRTR